MRLAAFLNSANGTWDWRPQCGSAFEARRRRSTGAGVGWVRDQDVGKVTPVSAVRFEWVM